MSIDGLMPPDLVKEPVLIGDFSAYGVFAQHKRQELFRAVGSPGTPFRRTLIWGSCATQTNPPREPEC
jgi:hypothetical protein